MRILIVKMSSLGDVIHTLPALTDAYKHYPHISWDWVVEEAFSEIPLWHPAIERVIPIALRRWRHHIWRTWSQGHWQQFRHHLQAHAYDRIIDAQGLLKSAWITFQARGQRYGFDSASAREPLATLGYHQRYRIAPQQHAVERIRQLFAAILDYSFTELPLDYGINDRFQGINQHSPPIIVFLIGSTWITKLWPQSHWLALAARVIQAGYAIRLPWGNEAEYQRAQEIAAVHPQIELIPKSNLETLAYILVQAQAIVGVDSGLAHLAAALKRPTVTLYAATEPRFTGTYANQQCHLQADFPCAPCFNKTCRYRRLTDPPCYTQLSVEKVWLALQSMFSAPLS
ncbi:MAG: lipopolysaccharide heptosyltransferase I [Pseudomonadota bacterium]|nr:lipopolysaccharide heptosyltransferase I [Pseudomonadota bacterium]